MLIVSSAISPVGYRELYGDMRRSSAMAERVVHAVLMRHCDISMGALGEQCEMVSRNAPHICCRHVLHQQVLVAFGGDAIA